MGLLSMPDYAPAATLNDDTRRLCCAPYVDVEFGAAVIHETMESERKAVPPSYGFDLDPVVRHCLRARRLLLVRYLLVTVLLIVGVCANPVATLGWLTLCGVVEGFRSPEFRRLPRAVRWGSVAVLAVGLSCLGGFVALQSVFGDLADLSELVPVGVGGVFVVAPFALAVAMFFTLFVSRRHAYTIMTTELAPGARFAAPNSGNPRVEARLATVAAMQRGNVCVQDVDPFAGAGFREHTWSFAISLKPSDHDPVDSADLNRRVSDAVLALRGEQLAEGERIRNVYVVPYVAADGLRRSDDPLIDPERRVPRTLASPETIAAIQRTPQGGLRHYLRAVVPAAGKGIRTPDGRLVLPAQDSGIGVTAFVHLAVEGGMLYAEFVATVMPQVRPAYHLVDNLRPDRAAVRALIDTVRRFTNDTVLGPPHLLRLTWNTLRLTSRMKWSGRRADEYRFYDYGAHFSVRELASERPTVKFMQMLDSGKYIKLLDKTVTETVLDYLEEKGVDTSEFRTLVTNVMVTNFNATFHGGQQSFGGRNTNVQTNAAPAPAARPSGGATGG